MVKWVGKVVRGFVGDDKAELFSVFICVSSAGYPAILPDPLAFCSTLLVLLRVALPNYAPTAW